MNFSKEHARDVIGSIIQQVQKSAKDRGVSLRCVGSLGICSLLGVEPKIFRKINGSKMECVDSDFMAAWPSGMSNQEIKALADYWWTLGMSEDKYLSPVSIINLPSEVANDPNAVLNFTWEPGKNFFYTTKKNRIVDLPLSFVDQSVEGEIFGRKVETITPYAHIAIKAVAEYHNPIRVLKDAYYCMKLIRKFNLGNEMLKLQRG